MAIEEKNGEVYLVRVQLINVWDGQEKEARSFDYEVSPTTESYQEPLFLRAEAFYNKLQDIMKGSGGKVTVTSGESLSL